ncbi:MAG: VCBS repeat-containing protein, partial [Actinomycetes bacterium]
MTLLVFVAALAGAQGAFAAGKQLFAAGQAPTAQNIPGRDAAVVLSDLGKGKAALSTFITVGQTSQAVKMWSGPLPVSHAKLVAGDFNTDGYTDALVLVDAGKRRTNLMLFTSDGTQFTLSATWTSKAGQIVWASASMTSGRFTRAGTDCALVTCRLANGKTVIYAFEDVFGSLTGRCLYKSAGAGLAAKAQIACGDVNKDLSDEAVIFSPAAKGGSLHFYAYDGTGLTETTSTAVGGSTTGAQLACGDVNGDGRDEPLLLTRSGSSTTLTAYSVDGEAVSSTRVPVSSPFAKSAQIGAADMNGDGRSDPVALSAAGKTRGSFVVGLSGSAGVTTRAAWSGAMRTAGARFACAHTVSTIVKDNVRQLPGSLA